ncbi:hypothetical protein V2J09_009023 [Rumex salicifolius]
MSMLLVDFSNAFNLIDRSSMLTGVRRRCPSLSRWVEFCYTRPARVRVFLTFDPLITPNTLHPLQPSVLLHSLFSPSSVAALVLHFQILETGFVIDLRLHFQIQETGTLSLPPFPLPGVEQGDPFGPLLFALTLHQLVHRINEDCNLYLMALYLDEELNRRHCMMIVSDGLRVLTLSRVAPKNEETLKELEKKHPHAPCPIMVLFWAKVEVFSSSKDVVLSRIKSFPKGTSCGRDGVWAQPLVDALWKAAIVVANDLVSSITVVVNLLLAGKCPSALGEFIASSRPIVVRTVWQRLASKVAALVVRNEFGVGVRNIGEAIHHIVNRLIEALGGAHNMSMLMVDFSNAFNLIDRSTMLSEVRHCCPSLSPWVEFCYARPAR